MFKGSLDGILTSFLPLPSKNKFVLMNKQIVLLSFIQWHRMKTAPYTFSIKWLVHKPAFFLECLAGVKHASKFLAFSHQLMWVLRLPKSSSHPCAQRGCKTASPQTFFTLKKKAFYVVDFPILMQQILWGLAVLQPLGVQGWLVLFRNLKIHI